MKSNLPLTATARGTWVSEIFTVYKLSTIITTTLPTTTTTPNPNQKFNLN